LLKKLCYDNRMERTVTFGRYQLVRRLAQGGMAEIYLAKLVGAAGVEKTLALKRIHTRYVEEPRFLELFINEGRISSSLSHSNIVAVYDFGRVGSEYYLAMEYVPGRDIGSLLHHVTQQKLFVPWGLVLYIGAQALVGLSYLHRRHKVIHGDITPRNLLLSQEGEVKLADFGVARVGQVFEGKLRGTLRYMSPEQAKAQISDPRTDLFSLALVLSELLQGTPVYQDDDALALREAVQKAELAPLRALDVSTPQGFLEILQRALSADKEGRFSSADEMLSALEPLFAQAKQNQSPCNASGLSTLLQKHFGHELQPGEQVELEANNQPSQSFAETRTALSGGVTKTGEALEPNQPHHSPETPLATQRIDLALSETPRGRRWQMAGVGALVVLLAGFLSLLHQPTEPVVFGLLGASQTNSLPPVSLPVALPTLTAPASPPNQPNTVPSAPADHPTKKNELKKKVGYLNLNVKPWAEIEIDGKPKGETPLLRMALTPGMHSIKAHHPILKITRTYSVHIIEGVETTKSFSLQP
jgi:serine/threonine protein kinase